MALESLSSPSPFRAIPAREGSREGRESCHTIVESLSLVSSYCTTQKTKRDTGTLHLQMCEMERERRVL